MGGAQTKCHLRSHPHLEEENYRFEGTKISQQVHFPIVIFDQSTITKARGHNVKTSICIDGHSSTGYYFKLWTFGWSFDEIGRQQNFSPDWYPLLPLITKPPIYDSIATVGEIRVYRMADFQSGSRVLKKVF